MSSIPDPVVIQEIVTDAVRISGLRQPVIRDTLFKDDGSVVTSTDHLLQDMISKSLRQRWPDIPFMGEEMEHQQQAEIVNRAGGQFWALDPLDGTTNFTMGFPFYGISLALIGDGEVDLGVVYDPVRDELFHAVRGCGAYLNGQLLQTRGEMISLDLCVANVDLKRLVGQLAERLVRSPPYRSQRNLGSCVLEWCWVAAGRIQLYLHGGQRMWDYAAGSLILREAGGACSTLKGTALNCHMLTKRSVVAAVNETLYKEWFQWIRENDSRN